MYFALRHKFFLRTFLLDPISQQDDLKATFRLTFDLLKLEIPTINMFEVNCSPVSENRHCYPIFRLDLTCYQRKCGL